MVETPIYKFKKRQLSDIPNIEIGEENWDILEEELKRKNLNIVWDETDRDNILNLVEGIMCYVQKTETYYVYKKTGWEVFSSGGDESFMGEIVPEKEDPIWFDTSDTESTSFIEVLTDEIRTLIGGMRQEIVALKSRVQALEGGGVITPPISASMLLLENGDYLITEDGNYVCIE